MGELVFVRRNESRPPRKESRKNSDKESMESARVLKHRNPARYRKRRSAEYTRLAKPFVVDWRRCLVVVAIVVVIVVVIKSQSQGRDRSERNAYATLVGCRAANVSRSGETVGDAVLCTSTLCAILWSAQPRNNCYVFLGKLGTRDDGIALKRPSSGAEPFDADQSDRSIAIFSTVHRTA